jgi:anaerobic selenocysteine-containing dehydrogenase
MSERTGDGKLLDRRGFLKGSAIFAAAAGLAAAVPAAAQEQAPVPTEKEKPQEPKKEEPPKKKVLLDENGREYRVCDVCGGNMYQEDKTWTCEQCGFSYEE